MVKKYGRLLLLVCSLLLLPLSTVSAAPNVMDELTPESDLPETSAPVVQYNEFPSDHYQMDVYVKAEEEEGEGSIWSSLNPFNVDDKVMKNISTFQHQILSGIWYGYVVLVNAGIYVMEQAFTFDLIGSMLGYVATFIGEIGGTNGIGQFMSFVLILTAGWLVYVFVKRQFRHAFGGLIIAAILSAFFTVYIQNSDTLLGWMNDSRNQLSNSVLNASTYNIDTNNEEPMKTDNVKYDGDISDETTVRYGLSRIRNLMHDLLIVKPYLFLEFGSTNLAVIGGAESSDNYTEANIQAGKDRLKELLKEKPGSDKRKDVVNKYKNNSLFEPDKTNQRIVLALLVWIPAIAILGLTGFMAVQVQVYGIAFLITAAIGVFILMMSIFPATRSFAFQWGGKLITFLFMSVAFTFGLVLMFSFVNIIYKVGGENNWNYVQTVIAVLIVVASMVFLNKQLWGYKMVKQNMDRIKENTEKRVEAIKEKRRIQQEREEYGYVPAANGPGMQPVARRNYNGKTTERMMDAIQKQHLSSVNGPIKKKAQGTESAKLNEQTKAAENKGNSSPQASVMDQIKKQQANDPGRIKKQSGGEGKAQTEAAATKESDQTNGSGNTNDIQKRIQRQQAQDSGRIKKQPKTLDHVKPSSEAASQAQTQDQLERAKARDRKEKESYQGKNVITFPTRQDQSMKEEDIQREKQLKELLKGRKEVATSKNLNQDQIEQIHKHQSNSDRER